MRKVAMGMGSKPFKTCQDEGGEHAWEWRFDLLAVRVRGEIVEGGKSCYVCLHGCRTARLVEMPVVTGAVKIVYLAPLPVVPPISAKVRVEVRP